jgi:hypothetical protein
MKGRSTWFLGIGFVLALLFIGTSSWAVPRLINYQGMLTDASGTPLDGAYNMTFRLFDAENGGTELWAETQNAVPVAGGIYNVRLGAVTPLAEEDFSGDVLCLQVEIYNETTLAWEILSPRQRLTSTAFAFRAATADTTVSAGNADTLDGLDSTALQRRVMDSCSPGSSIRAVNADGTVVCEPDDTGIVSETDPTVPASLKDGVSWKEILGIPPGFADGVDDGITVETDPTVPASLKDGVSWSEILNIPPGFADGVDNDSGGDIKGVTAGTGLSGGGTSDTVTLSVAIPLSLTGSLATGVINAFNNNATTGYGLYGFAAGSNGLGVYGSTSGTSGYGVEGVAAGSSGRGVYGYASNEGDVTNYGGYFWAVGTSGRGVYGYASDTGGTNYGGYFSASGVTGRGVYGYASNSGGTNYGGRFYASGSSGYGVYAQAGADTGANYGGYFEADGNQGRGIHARVDNPGSGLKYAGYFEVDSETGYGVYSTVNGEYTNWAFRGEAKGTGSDGAWFSTVGEGTRAVYGNATGTTGTYNDNRGGQFVAAGNHGYGVHASATGTYGTGIFATGGTSGYAAVFLGNVKIQRKSDGATVMELGAGLDYAEGFDVSRKDGIGPGSVLVIDPENPGKLALSRVSYDSKVAGIVAGANSLGSGVRLGAGQYDHDVALAGRVYCNVDASREGIEPGDLLTTSDVPGHAMKATDHSRAQGAILGKAMQRLPKGTSGQILVLVTLQ